MKPAIKELNDQYRSWAHNLLTERWGSHFVVSRGRVYEADRLPGFVAFIEAKPKGLITYRIINEECEVVTLDSLIGGIEIGTALLDAVKRVGRNARLPAHLADYYQRQFVCPEILPEARLPAGSGAPGCPHPLPPA
jgi:hypothetical protein